MSNKPALRDHRLRILEGVLAWEGEVGNARVRQLFDIQPVQASRLLADFRTLMVGKIVEDGRAKVLKPLAEGGIETDITLDEYVRHVQGGEQPDSFIVDSRIDLTAVKPRVFALLRKATLTKQGVVISYASMSSPDYKDRLIFPHSIIHVGRRWHVRAWCNHRKDFRDFTLGRIRQAEPMAVKAVQGIESDAGWNEMITLRLAAHRALSLEQQKVVRGEYFAGTMGRRLSVRACLVQYVIQDLRAAVNPEKERPPEFQIEVGNAMELGSVLF